MQDILHAFGVNWKLLVIQILNFGVLLFLLHRYLYQPVFAMLLEREKRIAQGLKDADDVGKEKEAVESRRAETLREVRKEGDRLLADVRARTKEEEKKKIFEAEERAKKIITDAERLGEQTKEEIIQSSQEELARIAVKAAEKALKG